MTARGEACEVARLADGVLPAGRLILTWDGAGRSGRVAAGRSIVCFATTDGPSRAGS